MIRTSVFKPAFHDASIQKLGKKLHILTNLKLGTIGLTVLQ